MASEATATRPFTRELQVIQQIAAVAQDRGFRVGRFNVSGDGKDRIIVFKLTRPEDDSALLESGQGDLSFEDGGSGARDTEPAPELPPPSWYQRPEGSDEERS